MGDEVALTFTDPEVVGRVLVPLISIEPGVKKDNERECPLCRTVFVLAITHVDDSFLAIVFLKWQKVHLLTSLFALALFGINMRKEKLECGKKAWPTSSCNDGTTNCFKLRG